jgi:hypothetical protein
VVYYFLDNIGIMAACGYSMLGGYTTESTDESTDPTSTDKLTVHVRCVPINIGLKLKTKIGNFEPYMYLAPGVYYPEKSSTETITGQSDKTGTWEYDRGFGIAAGIGTVYRISGKIGIKVEIAPTYAFANLTQYMWEQDGTKHTTIYFNDTRKLPASGGDPLYTHGQPRDSFSSVSVKTGICYGF